MLDIQFSYKISEKDFIDYYHFIFYEIKGKTLFAKLPFLLLLCFIFFLYVLINPSVWNQSILVMGITSVIMLTIIVPLWIHYYAKKNYEKNYQIKYVNDYYINDKEITIKTHNESSNYSFEKVKKIYESKKLLFCFINNVQIIIIPKKYINVENFIKFLQENYPHLIIHIKKK